MRKLLFLFVLFLFAAPRLNAAVTLPKIFADNMVLQREMKVPVWGNAAPGENITVILGGHQAKTLADRNGHWKVFIGPLDAGGPFVMKIRGNNEVDLRNILVGEVWICSGQSNMAMEVRSSMNAEEEIASADYPEIRYFQVKNFKASHPMEDVSPVTTPGKEFLNHWQICSPSTVGHLTGVGYFFGRDLHTDLGVPVGLISVSWGGTTAEAWTPYDALADDPVLKDILTDWPDYNNDEQWLKSEYNNYLNELKNARKEGQELPLYFNQPSVLYNGMLAPVEPYGIRGVVWYQGESNAYRAYQYRRLFPLMINSWRDKWNQGDFPFLFVQLAAYKFEPQVFPELREAQERALDLPNTAMAVAIDVGDSATIHPKNKQAVGRRLALAAEKMVYQFDIIFAGPLFSSMLIRDGKCFLTFDHTGDGLITSDGKAPRGFMVAGDDRNFVKAKAEIRNNTMVVWSENVTHPVAVRYAWKNYPPEVNLYNKSGSHVHLPASPFRTDNWPGITFGRTGNESL